MSVDLGAGTGSGADQGSDSIATVENVTGSPQADTLTGSGGANTLSGGAGTDVLNGGDGNDTLRGGDGDDNILGGDGNDHLYGDPNDDNLDGGPGNDTLDGGTGNNSCSGGGGTDTILDTCDGTPPVVTGFQMDNTAIDTSADAVAVPIHVDVSDDLSGVARCSASFASPTGAHVASTTPMQPDGTMSAYFDKDSETGTWTITSLTCADRIGNTTNLTTADFRNAGWPHTIVNGMPAPADPVVGAAGDVACSPNDPNFKGGAGTTNYCHQRDTANLLDGGLADILTLGDNQYENGELSNFQSVFDLTWGAAKSRLKPSVGNREYNSSASATGYFDYFNGAGIITGARDSGYFSYDVGDWHLISLNSNCASIGGCYAGSAQEEWLRADLAAHPTECTLAYWHHPLFTSGQTGNSANTKPLFQALYDANAEIVLAGHDHDYERFAPQTPTGELDNSRGVREFVVGTGGESHHPFSYGALTNEQVRNDDTFGILRLTLHPGSYDWKFQPIAGQAFTDSGTSACH